MANRLYTTVQTDQGRAILFDPGVAWTVVHPSRFPCVVAFTEAGVTQIDGRSGTSIPELLEKLTCLIKSGQGGLLVNEEERKP